MDEERHSAWEAAVAGEILRARCRAERRTGAQGLRVLEPGGFLCPLWTSLTKTSSSEPPRVGPERVFYGMDAVRSFFEGPAETVEAVGVTE